MIDLTINTMLAVNSKLYHPNVVCDLCDQFISGIRYKCLNCFNYDVCEKCLEQQVLPIQISANKFLSQTIPGHNEQHLFTAITQPLDKPFIQLIGKDFPLPVMYEAIAVEYSLENNYHHSDHLCDNCDGEIYGIRYHCANCEDFDLCSKCHTNSQSAHSTNHAFVLVIQPISRQMRSTYSLRFSTLYHETPEIPLSEPNQSEAITLAPPIHDKLQQLTNVSSTVAIATNPLPAYEIPQSILNSQSEYELRPYNRATDFYGLVALDSEAFGTEAWDEEHLERLNDDISDFYSDRMIVAVLKSEESDYFSTICGHVVFEYLENNPEQLHITALAISSAHQQRKLGERLLREAFKLIYQEQCEVMQAQGSNVEAFLHVRVNNQPAIKLYQRLGFEVIGIEQNYYRKNPTEQNAYAMKMLMPID
jgi:ribosomal protein S18 acetylase RimI-like enzyme/predicted amidophosphoribosyltransferase